MRDDDFAGLIAGLESKGQTRSAIARAAGISRVTVWRIATGQARAPAYDTIQRLKRLDARTVDRAVSPMKQKTR